MFDRATSVSLWVCALALMILPVSIRAEIPALFREEAFNAAILAQAVNHYVDLGEAAAVKELAVVAPKGSYLEQSISRLNVAVRVAWVCRILFEPRGKEPLRPPGYGGLSLPELSMPLKTWPLYPVVASGKSYFVLSGSYIVGGFPEDTLSYLAYCCKAGRFRTEKVPVPDRFQAQADATLLRQSKSWLELRWKDEQKGSSYTLQEDRVWAFIQSQADNVP